MDALTTFLSRSTSLGTPYRIFSNSLKHVCLYLFFKPRTCPSLAPLQAICTILWKGDYLLKIKMFCWIMLPKKVLMVENLNRSGIQGPHDWNKMFLSWTNAYPGSFF